MTTVNQEEIQKFSLLADEWWNMEGKFKPLHMFNPIRIKYIIDICSSHYNLNKDENLPLKGLKILDIGCGGGLISEPMCRLGAQVTGIDASEKNIKVAKLHAKKNNLNIEYLCTSPENFKENTKFDVILNMEIIEHVENVDFFLESCSKLLKKNGIMFVATINKTLKSYLFAIIGAEYIMRWLPKGTHEWNKFITPEELFSLIETAGLEAVDRKGFVFNPITWQWRLSDRDLSVNYVTASVKA